MLYALIVILVLFIAAFITIVIVDIKMTAETFKKLCEKKVKRIAKRHNLLSLGELKLLNFNREELSINQVVFGKKYIYLIIDLMLKGFVSGEVNDNSWVYFNNIKRTTHYVSNLNKISDKNLQDFAGILNINKDLIIPICLVPNGCDFKIKGLESEPTIVVHYSSLNRKIRRFEKQDIDSLDEKQIYEQFKKIERRNKESQAE